MNPPPDSASPEPLTQPNKDAIAAIVDVTKLETSLATGVLAFSIGLVTSSTALYSAAFEPLLILAWGILGVAILAGVWALYYAATLYSDPTFTIDAAEVRVTTAINQLGFVVGSLMIATVLVVAMIAGPSREEARIRSADDALRIAEASQGVAGHRISKVNTIELIKGSDPARLSTAVWHVQIVVDAPTDTYRSAMPRTVDVYINPVNGAPPAHVAAAAPSP